jgi:hypothetical protein
VTTSRYLRLATSKVCATANRLYEKFRSDVANTEALKPSSRYCGFNPTWLFTPTLTIHEIEGDDVIIGWLPCEDRSGDRKMEIAVVTFLESE